jgi:hypothetical protein
MHYFGGMMSQPYTKEDISFGGTELGSHGGGGKHSSIIVVKL